MGGEDPPVETARPRRRIAGGAGLLLALLAGLGFVEYGRALAFPFSRDDAVHFAMTERWKRSPAQILDHFREDFWAGEPDHGLYRPLTCATIQATAWASGLSPRPLRAGNVLLLVATGLAAAALARRAGLSRGASALLAAAIVAHPLLSEGVLEVVSRGELQATALALVAAALLHGKRRFPLLGALAAAAAFLLALLSKEGAFAALPALLLLLLPMRRHGFFAPALLLLAAVGVALWMRVRVLGGAVGLDPRVVTTLDNCLVDQALGVRVLTGVANLGRSVGLFFWPARMSADYSFASIVPLHAPDGRFALGAAALVAGGVWLVVALRRGRRIEAFGLLLAGASWFLVSSIASPIGTIFSERVLCMPACGVLIALAAATDRIAGARAPAVRRAAAAVALAFVAALGVRTFVRAGDWRNESTLYTAALSVAPESARVQCTVAQWLHEAKDPIGAGARARRALEIKPDYRKPMSELGRLAFETWRAQRQPQFLAQADVWFWLAANAPGSDADDARNLEQIDEAVRTYGVARADLERIAIAIADAHAGQLLYEKLRIAFATQH